MPRGVSKISLAVLDARQTRTEEDVRGMTEDFKQLMADQLNATKETTKAINDMREESNNGLKEILASLATHVTTDATGFAAGKAYADEKFSAVSEQVTKLSVKMSFVTSAAVLVLDHLLGK